MLASSDATPVPTAEPVRNPESSLGGHKKTEAPKQETTPAPEPTPEPAATELPEMTNVPVEVTVAPEMPTEAAETIEPDQHEQIDPETNEGSQNTNENDASQAPAEVVEAFNGKELFTLIKIAVTAYLETPEAKLLGLDAYLTGEALEKYEALTLQEQMQLVAYLISKDEPLFEKMDEALQETSAFIKLTLADDPDGWKEFEAETFHTDALIVGGEEYCIFSMDVQETETGRFLDRWTFQSGQRGWTMGLSRVEK